MVKVELVYVARDRSTVQVKMDLERGSTVAEAITQSGIYHSHPETRDLPVGIYAKQVSLETVLKDGDRVEIYRTLTQDPKENRRQRARIKK
jgi:putative ubiquitin-RnfH superfamily antitoxin RatB of RatAB toxin-antitoxin module